LLLADSVLAVPQKEQADVTEMQRTQQGLENAKRELQNAADNGGHRNKVFGRVVDALDDMLHAEAWEREHHELKK
jgi:hypothetical protein